MPLTMDQLLARLHDRPQPSARWFGQRILSVDGKQGRVEATFSATADFASSAGTIQGGFVAAILDDLCALAAIVKADAPILIPTIDFAVRFFAPILPGPLIGRAHCVKLGRRIAFLESSLFDENETRLASMSATGMSVPLQN